MIARLRRQDAAATLSACTLSDVQILADTILPSKFACSDAAAAAAAADLAGGGFESGQDFI